MKFWADLLLDLLSEFDDGESFYWLSMMCSLNVNSNLTNNMPNLGSYWIQFHGYAHLKEFRLVRKMLEAYHCLQSASKWWWTYIMYLRECCSIFFYPFIHLEAELVVQFDYIRLDACWGLENLGFVHLMHLEYDSLCSDANFMVRHLEVDLIWSFLWRILYFAAQVEARKKIMSSVSSQPQFRYTQPPSKVLHLRNLPWECTEEELIELGKPFGRVVNTKCNVGANRNQAFIEFVSVNCCLFNWSWVNLYDLYGLIVFLYISMLYRQN